MQIPTVGQSGLTTALSGKPMIDESGAADEFSEVLALLSDQSETMEQAKDEPEEDAGRRIIEKPDDHSGDAAKPDDLEADSEKLSLEWRSEITHSTGQVVKQTEKAPGFDFISPDKSGGLDHETPLSRKVPSLETGMEALKNANLQQVQHREKTQLFHEAPYREIETKSPKIAEIDLRPQVITAQVPIQLSPAEGIELEPAHARSAVPEKAALLKGPANAATLIQAPEEDVTHLHLPLEEKPVLEAKRLLENTGDRQAIFARDEQALLGQKPKNRQAEFPSERIETDPPVSQSVDQRVAEKRLVVGSISSGGLPLIGPYSEPGRVGFVQDAKALVAGDVRHQKKAQQNDEDRIPVPNGVARGQSSESQPRKTMVGSAGKRVKPEGLEQVRSVPDMGIRTPKPETMAFAPEAVQVKVETFVGLRNRLETPKPIPRLGTAPDNQIALRSDLILSRSGSAVAPVDEPHDPAEVSGGTTADTVKPRLTAVSLPSVRTEPVQTLFPEPSLLASDPDPMSPAAPTEIRTAGGTVVQQAPNAPVSADPVSVIRQIANASVGTKDNGIEIRLSPEELGSIRMQLTTTDLGTAVTIHADRPETLELLRRHIDILARNLADAGYEAAEFSFGDQRQQGAEKASFLNQDPDDSVPEQEIPKLTLKPGTSGIDIRL
ncbi:flagellar hook-length control protein FliK [Thalassococcus lentus]|uniref:Flagellar hook-length control protein FliK n=1 Tax=Thalassococcus lentus TaxID=1210524 RepID=A0ABT4XN09_9RHOB|nr:flagellar hook-length control protein FliK [Thalassococcus lentus]MDA7423315.1 flagellar hook-length control protein FliK [Thalassococcus lentus]